MSQVLHPRWRQLGREVWGLGVGRGGVAAKTCAAIGGNLYQELRNIRNVEFKFVNEDYYETVE